LPKPDPANPNAAISLARPNDAVVWGLHPALKDSMLPLWQKGQFGRTFRENGTHGTDHGHGSTHWVLGGAVHGGCFAGDQVAVTPSMLHQNRDFAGADRIPKHARRHLQTHVFTRQRADRSGVSECDAARIEVGVMRLRGRSITS